MTASPDTDLRVGDTVRLVSGGPAMVITRIDIPSIHYVNEVDVYCLWFDDNELCNSIFPSRTICKTKADVE